MSAQTNKNRKPEKKPEESRSSRRRSNTASRILENVELLIALHESQENEEHGIAESLSQQMLDLEARFELFTEHFDQKTDRVLETVNDQITKITSALAGQQALLESGDASSDETISSALEQVNQKMESLTHSFDARIDDLFGNLGSRISQISEKIARQGTDPAPTADPESNDDSVSHWQRQKAAMLSKYGIDPEYRPVKELSDNSAAEAPAEPESPMEEVTENLESLHDSIENISAADAEAIENLKSELTSKLRDAEVEFSINRAKLSQLKAELDDRQVELERRATALEEKHQASGNKSGFLDRLTRHLSLRKRDQPDLDE